MTTIALWVTLGLGVRRMAASAQASSSSRPSERRGLVLSSSSACVAAAAWKSTGEISSHVVSNKLMEHLERLLQVALVEHFDGEDALVARAAQGVEQPAGARAR